MTIELNLNLNLPEKLIECVNNSGLRKSRYFIEIERVIFKEESLSDFANRHALPIEFARYIHHVYWLNLERLLEQSKTIEQAAADLGVSYEDMKSSYERYRALEGDRKAYF